MQVKGLSPGIVEFEIRRVSDRFFAGNLTSNRKPEPYRGSVRFTLRVSDCRGPGHRRGVPHPWEGHVRKRMVAACYHAYGEVIRGLLEAGAAWVQTAPITLERYRSKGAKPKRWTRETWSEHADAMAYVNIGSQMSPFNFAEACDCEVREMPGAPIKYPASPDCKTIPADWPRAEG